MADESGALWGLSKVECTDFVDVGHRIVRFMGAFYRNLIELGFNLVGWHRDPYRNRVNYEDCSGELSEYSSID